MTVSTLPMPLEIFVCVGERCAAHTDDTGLLDHFDHFLHAQRVGVGRSMDFLAQVVLEVIVDDNGHDLAAHGIGTGLHRSDRTGYACVNGSAETFEFADLLSKLDIVALETVGVQGAPKCIDMGITT